MDYAKMTNAQFRKAYRRAKAESDAAVTAVYALALHGHERYLDICARLGDDHAAVTAARAFIAAEELRQAELDGHRRYGSGIAWTVYL